MTQVVYYKGESNDGPNAAAAAAGGRAGCNGRVLAELQVAPCARILHDERPARRPLDRQTLRAFPVPQRELQAQVAG